MITSNISAILRLYLSLAGCRGMALAVLNLFEATSMISGVMIGWSVALAPAMHGVSLFFFSTSSPLPSSSSSCHNHHTNETLWKHTCRVTVLLHTQDIYAHLVYLQTSAANPRQNQFLFPLGVFKNIFLRDKPSHLATILLPFELCSLFKMGLRGSLGSNLSRAAIQNRKIDEYPMCNRHDATELGLEWLEFMLSSQFAVW